MDRYYVTLEGPALWQITVAVLVALWLNLISRYGLERVSDWWYGQRSTVEDAAPTGDGPVGREPEPRFVPKDAPAEEDRIRMSDALWWETSVAIHRADCRWARRGTPLEFVWSEAEAKERADQDGKRGCRHCDPFGVAWADTGELEAVSS